MLALGERAIDFFEQRLAQAHDAVQRRTQFVAHDGKELVLGTCGGFGHVLGLHQCLLRLAPRRDVVDRDEDGLVIGQRDGHGREERPEDAIGGKQLHLAVGKSPFLQHLCDDALAVAGIDKEFGQRLAADGVRVDGEEVQRPAVRIQQRAVGSAGDDAWEGCIVNQRAIALFALTNRLFHPHALGRVAQRNELAG